MKKLLLLLCVLISVRAWSMSVTDAFQAFFEDPQLSSSHCGRNVGAFLSYLKKNNVAFDSGFVVSVHDQHPVINHFDARWGSHEKYADGSSYLRSNWFFHVFVVIDGRAYDFSQQGAQSQILAEYLESAYIPKSPTKNIFGQGRLDRKTVFTAFLNWRMNIYQIDDYRENLGPASYEGSFAELFYYAFKRPLRSTKISPKGIKTAQKSIFSNAHDASYTIEEPALESEHGTLPLRPEATAICRAYGFWGSLKNKTEEKMSALSGRLKIYSFIKGDEAHNFVEPEITASHKLEKNGPGDEVMASAARVSCSDLASYLAYQKR